MMTVPRRIIVTLRLCFFSLLLSVTIVVRRANDSDYRYLSNHHRKNERGRRRNEQRRQQRHRRRHPQRQRSRSATDRQRRWRRLQWKTATTTANTISSSSSHHNNVMNAQEFMNELKDDIEHQQQQQLTKERIELLLSTYQGGSDHYQNRNHNLTVIVHIGPQKTGSSTIQQFMQQDRMLQSLRNDDRYARVPDVNVVMDKSFTSCFRNEPINITKWREEQMKIREEKRQQLQKQREEQQEKMRQERQRQHDQLEKLRQQQQETIRQERQKQQEEALAKKKHFHYNNKYDDRDDDAIRWSNDDDNIDIDDVEDEDNNDLHHRSLLQIGTFTANIDYNCHVETIEETIQLAVRDHYSLLYTSETIADINFNVSKLYHFLHMYYDNIYVVAYYRRFFSWIVSLHNQQTKNSHIPTRISLVDYLNNHNVVTNNLYYGYYFYGAVHRFQHHFHEHQIRYYHLNHLDQPSLLEHFFCTAIPDSHHTCGTTRDIIQQDGIPHSNGGIDFIYLDLAYYAHQMNLLSSEIMNAYPSYTAWILKVANAAKYHQYYTLQIHNSYDFGNRDAIICPTRDTYDLLWNLTIHAENRFFPQYYNESSQYHADNEVVKEFQHYIDHYKFCHINATMILLFNNNRWHDFFMQLSLPSVRNPDMYPIILSPQS